MGFAAIALFGVTVFNMLRVNKKLDDLYWTSSDVRYDLPENVHWGFDNMDRDEEYFNFASSKL